MAKRERIDLDSLTLKERIEKFEEEVTHTLDREFIGEAKREDTPLRIAKRARQIAKAYFPDDVPKFNAVENEKNPFSYDLVWDPEWVERNRLEE